MKKQTKWIKMYEDPGQPMLSSSFLAKQPIAPKKKVQNQIEPDIDQLRNRKIEKEKSIDQKLEDVQISPTEKESIEKVFKLLANGKNYFGVQDVQRVLKQLGFQPSIQEIKLMIWEIDSGLNAQINDKTFLKAYKKCVSDKSGYEPKTLFNMVQYLMFCKPGKFRITVEDTLQLLYVRMGREQLDQEIIAIFGEEEDKTQGKSQNQPEKEISYSEYLEKVNARAMQARKEKALEKTKYGSIISKEDEDQANI